MIGGLLPPSNPTQGPIIDNLRLKQFGQISGNYCRGPAAVAQQKQEWDILTGFFTTNQRWDGCTEGRGYAAPNIHVLIGAKVRGVKQGLVSRVLNFHGEGEAKQQASVPPVGQLPLNKHNGQTAACTRIR